MSPAPAPTRAAARTRDPERTRRQVIDAAAHEFAERGFDGATLSGIARRAKVSKQLIHHHFGSKEQLFHQVRTERFRPAVDWRDTIPAKPSDLMAARFETRKGDEDYLRFLAWEAASARNRPVPDEDNRRLRIEAYGNAIREMQKQGTVPADMDYRLIQLAVLCLATYPIAFTQITRMVTGRNADDPQFRREWTEFLRRIGGTLFDAD